MCLPTPLWQVLAQSCQTCVQCWMQCVLQRCLQLNAGCIFCATLRTICNVACSATQMLCPKLRATLPSVLVQFSCTTMRNFKHHIKSRVQFSFQACQQCRMQRCIECSDAMFCPKLHLMFDAILHATSSNIPMTNSP